MQARDLAEEFLTLVLGDPQLLEAEFGSIIAASYPLSPGPPIPEARHPAGRQRGGAPVGTTRAKFRRHRPVSPAHGRQRSPPPRSRR